MVDPIQPINPANTPVPSVNPAQAYPPAPITQTPATTPTTTPATTNIQSTTSAIQSPLTIAQDLSIDFAAMGSNQQYFLGTLDLILAKARQYYRAFDYTTAAQYYDSFFSYFRKFALSYPSLGAWSNNFGAFYEMTITNYYLNRQNEADTFLNQVLEMALETGKRNMADEIRNSLNRGVDTTEQTFFKQLTQLQRDGELPVSGQLNVQINPGLLQQLAVQANNLNRGELAAVLFGFALIYQGVALYATQQQAYALLPQQMRQQLNPQQTLPFELLLWPYGFSHTGLPYAYQTLPEQFRLREPEPTDDEEVVTLTNPVTALGGNPDQDEERRKRRRMVNDSRRAKLKSQRTKPRITF
ncbi:MAG: hypothetical protein KC476_07215 [Cyanobacteria bacterium HKST-UBA06]|nr:hypothetical protein [Cyanobacteria bacterium HKST-UBA06]